MWHADRVQMRTDPNGISDYPVDEPRSQPTRRAGVCEAAFQIILSFFFSRQEHCLGTGDGGLLEGHMVRTGHGRAEIKPGGSYQTATPSHRVSRHTSNAELPTWYRP